MHHEGLSQRNGHAGNLPRPLRERPGWRIGGVAGGEFVHFQDDFHGHVRSEYLNQRRFLRIAEGVAVEVDQQRRQGAILRRGQLPGTESLEEAVMPFLAIMIFEFEVRHSHGTNQFHAAL